MLIRGVLFACFVANEILEVAHWLIMQLARPFENFFQEAVFAKRLHQTLESFSQAVEFKWIGISSMASTRRSGMLVKISVDCCWAFCMCFLLDNEGSQYCHPFRREFYNDGTSQSSRCILCPCMRGWFILRLREDLDTPRMAIRDKSVIELCLTLSCLLVPLSLPSQLTEMFSLFNHNCPSAF